MSKPTVYHARILSGRSYEEAMAACSQFRRLVGPEIEVIDPMRFKEHLAGQTLSQAGYDHILASDGFVVTRDVNDVRNADLVLLDFSDAKEKSIGVSAEMGVAYERGKPIVTILPDGSDDPHWHPFVRKMSGVIVETPAEAALVIRAILLYGVAPTREEAAPEKRLKVSPELDAWEQKTYANSNLTLKPLDDYEKEQVLAEAKQREKENLFGDVMRLKGELPISADSAYIASEKAAEAIRKYDEDRKDRILNREA